MSRLTQTSTTHNYSANDLLPDTIYNKIVLNKPSEYDNTERILCIDFDSVLYTSTYFPESSLLQFPTEELQIEEAKFRVRNKLQEITNNVEEWFNIKQTLVFIGGKNNFRYKLYPDYKKNRISTIKSPLLPIIKQFIINEIPNCAVTENCESDDYCYEIKKITNNNCVISSLDKDVHFWCSEVPLYDFRSYTSKELPNTIVVGQFKYMSEKDSRLAIATQILTGDTTDNIKGAAKIGKVYCEKNLHRDMTNFQFIKAILKGYLKANNNDIKLAKKNMKLNYFLLKLWTKDELKSLNL
jgi:5'-3' exonuclease